MTTPMTGMTPGSLGAAFTFSPALLGASPAAAHHLLHKHRSPAPLNAGFTTPEALAAMGMGMVGMGMGMTPGAGMTPNTSAGLGIPTIMAGMPSDESKKRDLAEILRLLALRPGRISEDGVERLAKRMGLECYKDTDTTSGMTTMSLGGKIFLLDIDFRENCITRVALSFANTPGPSTDLAAMADEILLRNLSPVTTRNQKGGRPPPPPLISPSLSAFADNLARLAKSDYLSSPPHLNCFMAITGIYRSLLAIFEHEKSSLEGGELTALCKGSGRPRMHVRGKVGLSIEYWKTRRFIPTPDDDDDDDDGETENNIWRVMIEVSEAPSDYTLNPITPVRTSSHWITDEVKKPTTDSLFGDPEETITDWLEPPLEELPDASDSRPPSSRFVARLDPPIAVPFQDELQLFNTLLLAPPAGIVADTLEALLFPGSTRTTTTGHPRRIWVPPSHGAMLGEEDDSVRHTYRLHSTLKPVFARHIYEVPFSHPKELAGIFAVLRQFVVVATLLRSCFGAPAPAFPGAGEGEEEEEEEDLDSFMADGGGSDGGLEAGAVLPVDVTLAEQPGVFAVGAIFPLRAGVASFCVEVGRNADMRVVEEGGEGMDVRGVERTVAVGEDLGLAVEWVRRR